MRRLVRYVALAAVVSLAGTQLASADRPAFNPACEGTKIEPVVSGTYAVPFGTGAGSITLVVTDTPAGEVFDFVTDSATHLASSVVAKGPPYLETTSIPRFPRRAACTPPSTRRAASGTASVISASPRSPAAVAVAKNRRGVDVSGHTGA
ncbi:MAG: hypothetical protein ACKVUT_03715 [Gaiella sp.]